MPSSDCLKYVGDVFFRKSQLRNEGSIHQQGTHVVLIENHHSKVAERGSLRPTGVAPLFVRPVELHSLDKHGTPRFQNMLMESCPIEVDDCVSGMEKTKEKVIKVQTSNNKHPSFELIS